MNDIAERGIYTDLMREFVKNGHKICILSPSEKRDKKQTHIIQSCGATIIKVKTGNIMKTGKIRKGIATILLEHQFTNAIRNCFSNMCFDLVLYSTPPVTFAKAIQYVKTRDKALSYLLLKDIFPQNAVDLGMLSSKGLLYRFFRRKERNLYCMSDYIGCMSQANVEYLLRNNTYLDKSRIHVNPNSLDLIPLDSTPEPRNTARKNLGIPKGSKVFIYGGSLGKPQCVRFIIACLTLNQNKKDRYFIICGGGTDAYLLKKYVKENMPNNVQLFDMLPQDEYTKMIAAADVGLVFLDNRFTIPNFPSRLLSYMESGLPILACTDPNTDVGTTITDGGFGWWCESDHAGKFTDMVDMICKEDVSVFGQRGRKYFEDHYTTAHSYRIMMEMLVNK